MGGSSSKSTSKPVDMTPQAFQNLQSPFADVLAQLLGYGPTSTTQAAAAPFRGSSALATGGAAAAGQTAGAANIAAGRGDVSSGGARFSKQGVPLASTGAASRAAGQPQQTGLMAALSQYAPTGDINDVLRGIPSYQGALTADLGANEQTLLDMLMGQQTGLSTSEQYLTDIISGKAGTGYSPTDNNPFIQAAIEAAQRPTFQALEETLSRTLPGRFTQAGQFVNPQGSSAFDVAAQMAARDAQQTAADIGTNISFQGFEAERGRQFEAEEAAAGRRQTAATQLPTVSRQEIDTTIANLQAQALPRLIQEQGIERGLALFQNQVNALLSVLGVAGGATQPTIGNVQNQKSSSFQLK